MAATPAKPPTRWSYGNSTWKRSCPPRSNALFDIRDEHNSGQIVTFFSAAWDGDEKTLPLSEGVKIQIFAPEHLYILTIPPFIGDGIHRYLAARPA